MTIDAMVAMLGVLLANALYFNTVPRMLTIFKEQSLDNFNPLPIMVMVLNAITWVLYGVHVSDWAIIGGNVFGGILCIFYSFKIFPLIDNRSQLHLCRAVLLIGLVTIAVEQTILRGWHINEDMAIFVEGLTATACCLVMFASPLSQIGGVIKSRDATSIYWPLTAVQCTNCLTWTVYGFAKDDVWVYGPNAAGFILGLTQVALLLIFGGCRSPKTAYVLPMEMIAPGARE